MDKFLSTNRQKAIVLTAASAIIWGATAPIMKLTLIQVPLFSLVFLRMAVASIVFLPFVYKKLSIKQKDASLFCWAAISGITIHLTLFFIGLKLTHAIYAALLIATAPIMTVAAASVFLKEKVTAKIIAATIVAAVGTAIIIGMPNGSITFKNFLGNLILIASAVSWVVHEIISKKILKKYDAATLTFYTMALGALSVVPMALFEYLKNPGWIYALDAKAIAGIIYGIFFASLIAYFAWQKGLSLLPAQEASFFFYIDPVSGAILAIILLGEKLTLPLVIGGALITSAVFLAEHKRRAHPLHR